MDGWRATSGEDLTQVTAEKIFTVKQSATGINSIGSNSAGGNDKVITFTEPHTFINGESVRVISNDGQVPDGLESNVVYYAVTTGAGIATNTNIKLAKTLNEALNDLPVAINNKGGLLKVVSRVSDKLLVIKDIQFSGVLVMNSGILMLLLHLQRIHFILELLDLVQLDLEKQQQELIYKEDQIVEMQMILSTE